MIITLFYLGRVTRVLTDPSNDDVENGGPLDLTVGDVIKCSAKAVPPATFFWEKVDGAGPDRVEGEITGDNMSEVRSNN